MIFIAGALLITPGVLTDLVGFSLLISPIRGLLRRRIRERLLRSFQVGPAGEPPNSRKTSPPRDVIIDSYVIEHDPQVPSSGEDP